MPVLPFLANCEKLEWYHFSKMCNSSLTLLVIIANYGSPVREYIVVLNIVEVLMNKITFWTSVRAEDLNAELVIIASNVLSTQKKFTGHHITSNERKIIACERYELGSTFDCQGVKKSTIGLFPSTIPIFNFVTRCKSPVDRTSSTTFWNLIGVELHLKRQ